ncbi:MAG: PIN domain-containing protein [Dehalococcoidia bacterium]
MLCDRNVWLALALLDHTHHDAARRWLETATKPGAVLFCRATQQTFLRLLTTAAVLAPYGIPLLTNQQA